MILDIIQPLNLLTYYVSKWWKQTRERKRGKQKERVGRIEKERETARKKKERKEGNKLSCDVNQSLLELLEFFPFLSFFLFLSVFLFLSLLLSLDGYMPVPMKQTFFFFSLFFVCLFLIQNCTWSAFLLLLLSLLLLSLPLSFGLITY